MSYCLPVLPPKPPPSCCIPYPNAVQEKEWHTIRSATASPEDSGDKNESVLYERNIKTCDPCMLPQVNLARMYKLPAIKMRPNEMDNYSAQTPPTADALPPKYMYSEDQGECNKRETRGPGIYPYRGYVPPAPLCMPDNVPCGFHFSEKQSQISCERTGKGGDESALKQFPPAPPCPPKIQCPPMQCPPMQCSPPTACCPPACYQPTWSCVVPKCGPCSPYR